MSGEFKSVCVFCGSRPGFQPEFVAQARALGAELARRGITLVYGGATVGVMGELANAALTAGGKVVGVIPHALQDRELSHRELSELHVVGTMHERKALMEKLSGGFIALPGGFGTFDELFEILTWAQLGLHRKPIGVLNVEGYFEPLFALVDKAVEAGFVPAAHRQYLVRGANPLGLLDALVAYEPPPPVEKWLSRSQT